MGQLASPQQLSRLIDHTLLRADATEADLLKLCLEAKQHKFFSVCVNSRWLDLASRELKGSESLAITVVGFPLGASLAAAKAFEAEISIERGAREIDMVTDLGALKSADWRAVEKDIAAVVHASSPYTVKVILETCLLSNDEITAACKAAVNGGAKFVKTSTGFSKSGATKEHIALMRQCVGKDIGVKASGGIGNYATARDMIEAGASRIGSSRSVQILAEAQGGAVPA